VIKRNGEEVKSKIEGVIVILILEKSRKDLSNLKKNKKE